MYDRNAHVFVVAVCAVSAMFLTVAVWWNGASVDAWSTFMMGLFTVTLWVPTVIWVLHMRNMSRVAGWRYEGDGQWKRWLYVDDRRMQLVVTRCESFRNTFWVTLMEDNPEHPFFGGALIVTHEYKHYGKVVDVMQDTELVAIDYMYGVTA